MVSSLREAMKIAITAADEASAQGDVPVGAVVVDESGTILAVSSNRRERDQNPIAHAEMLCLQRAAKKRRSWRLDGCTIISTLEPCLMCTAAIVETNLSRLVFGAFNVKDGAFSSSKLLYRQLFSQQRLEIIGGFSRTPCTQQLLLFFQNLRQDKKKP